MARTGPAAQPATSASAGQVAGQLLRLVRIAPPAFELPALLAGALGPAAGATTAPRWPRWTGSPAAGRRAPWGLLVARTGPAPQRATSASAGQVVGELLCLVRIELQGFELPALLAGAPRRLPAPPRRRAGLGGPWALPPAGVPSWGLLVARMGPAPQRATSTSAGQVVGELLRLVRTELQGFALPARTAYTVAHKL